MTVPVVRMKNIDSIALNKDKNFFVRKTWHFEKTMSQRHTYFRNASKFVKKNYIKFFLLPLKF